MGGVPNFTANELAGVFLKRWMARDIANAAIAHLRPTTVVTDSFYHVTRDGTLRLDLPGLLRTGRMDRQLRAARELSRGRK